MYLSVVCSFFYYFIYVFTYYISKTADEFPYREGLLYYIALYCIALYCIVILTVKSAFMLSR